MNKTTGTSKLVRPIFSPGMLLQHEDLELLNEYTRNLSRLMFGSLFGCGVVCGLEVAKPAECGEIVIGRGLAISCSGDPISVPNGARLKLDIECDSTTVNEWWVVLCRTVKHCSPRTSMCSSDENENPSACSREVEGYEIRLDQKRSPCGCSCPTPKSSDPKPIISEFQCADPESRCFMDHYDGKCGCNCVDSSDCDCDCVLLARLHRKSDKEPWEEADYSVRRLTRPVLMRDPLVPVIKPVKEDEGKKKPGKPIALTEQSSPAVSSTQ